MAAPQQRRAAWVRYCLETWHSWLFLTTRTPKTAEPRTQDRPR